MPTKKTAAASAASAAECCAKCESDIAALRKEVTALRKELGKKPTGAADPRVDKIVHYLKERIKEKPLKMSRQDFNKKLEKLVEDL